MENQSEIKFVNTKFIVADKYQREVEPPRVSKILDEFDARKVNPPKLSFRDGKYFVFDGQHTIAVLKARNGGKDLTMECRVYFGLTFDDEARLFEAQNGISRAVSMNDKLRSMFVRGESTAVSIVRIAEAIGFSVDFKKVKGPHRIVAMKVLNDVYTKHGESVYTTALGIIKAAWDGNTDSLRGEIIGGVSIFCAKYDGKFDRPLLIKKLSKILPIKIIREAKLSSERGARKYARRILEEYNKNLSINRLEDIL
jgi:hypothetical protein